MSTLKRLNGMNISKDHDTGEKKKAAILKRRLQAPKLHTKPQLYNRF